MLLAGRASTVSPCLSSKGVFVAHIRPRDVQYPHRLPSTVGMCWFHNFQSALGSGSELESQQAPGQHGEAAWGLGTDRALGSAALELGVKDLGGPSSFCSGLPHTSFPLLSGNVSALCTQVRPVQAVFPSSLPLSPNCRLRSLSRCFQNNLNRVSVCDLILHSTIFFFFSVCVWYCVKTIWYSFVEDASHNGKCRCLALGSWSCD